MTKESISDQVWPVAGCGEQTVVIDPDSITAVISMAPWATKTRME